MDPINENYLENTSAKDGGVIFQAKLSHKISWNIVNGETQFDQSNIHTRLHELEVFPDLNYKSGEASSVYYVLSEVNILKRKFDMASRSIKRLISASYSAEYDKDPGKDAELNQRYFDGTNIAVTLSTDRIALREVSTSGIDTGNPHIVLKVSTGLADNVDGNKLDPWSKFNIEIEGAPSDVVKSINSQINKIREYDHIENRWDIIFQTIIPSINIKLSGERVDIETFSSRSNNITNSMNMDVKTIFKEYSDEKPETDENTRF